MCLQSRASASGGNGKIIKNIVRTLFKSLSTHGSEGVQFEKGRGVFIQIWGNNILYYAVQVWHCPICSIQISTVRITSIHEYFRMIIIIQHAVAVLDYLRQWLHEREDMRILVLRLLDHDGDTQRHEGFGEVDHLLSVRCYRQRCKCYVCFLYTGCVHQRFSAKPGYSKMGLYLQFTIFDAQTI